MKKYYYGSTNPNLTDLKSSLSPNGKIYMTLNRTYALIYATYEYINLFIDDNEKIKFLNIYLNLFEKLYKNHIGYIYSAQLDEKEFLSDDTNGKRLVADSYYTLKNVKFDEKEEVDVFEEFMKLKEVGLFEVVEQKDIPEDYILDLKRFYKNKYIHNDMSKEEIEFFKKYFPDML